MIQPLRIIFMGTPDFSVPTLHALFNSSYQVVAVYSQPPRPSGRGYRIQKSPIHEYADAAQIPVFTPLSLKDKTEQAIFAQHHADLAVVVAYGLILPQAILDAPRLGCLNVHASLLPRWRGAAPIHRAIEAGDTETGITIMKMDAGLDTGPMLLKKTLPITPQTTAATLHDDLSTLGGETVLDAIEGYVTGSLLPVPQPQQGITYAHKLTREEGAIDWNSSADALLRKIQALTPWPGVWFEHNGTRLKVLKAEVISSLAGTPGMVLDGQLTIACGIGALRPTILQRPGGAPLNADAFLRGYPLPAGTRLCPATS